MRHDLVTKDDAVVAQLTRAGRALAEAKTIQDTKQVLDIAAAAEIYARRQHLSQDAIDYAHDIKIQALAQLGKQVAVMPKNVGAIAGKTGTKGVPVLDPAPTLADIGITKKESALAQKLATLADEAPALFEEVRAGTETMAKAIKTVNAQKAAEQMAEVAAQLSEERTTELEFVCDLRKMSCAELFATGIKPDAVITDPPYPKEFLHVYTELAKACKDVPLVAVMVGQTYLPEVMNRLCEFLTYRWTLAYLTPGGQSVQQHPRKINCFWKPVLLFGDSSKWLGDVSRSAVNDNDKAHHEWGQSVSGMVDLIDRLTEPGQMVCDPFLGGGTTAIASIKHSRRFVGCDIDQACVDSTWIRAKAMQ